MIVYGFIILTFFFLYRIAGGLLIHSIIALYIFMLILFLNYKFVAKPLYLKWKDKQN